MPEPLGIERGRMLALRPADGDADSVTVPENPLVGATVIMEAPEALGFSGPIAVGLAAMVKSGVVDAMAINFPVMYEGE